jgi:hypothetical protein
MTRQIDKNDVDISQLFKWHKEVEIADSYTGQKEKVYIRLVGDADINRARTYGYREAAVLRKNLKADGSDERLAFLAEVGEFEDREVLVNAIVLLRISDIYNQSIRETTVPEPKEPKSDGTQEEFENYQLAIDNYPLVFSEAVNQTIDKVKDRHLKELRNRPDDQLYKLYEKEVINRLCQEYMQAAYYDMCVFLGTFNDLEFTQPTFSSIEEYRNVHTHMKNTLKSEYQSLELGTDILKKLHEATE